LTEVERELVEREWAAGAWAGDVVWRPVEGEVAPRPLSGDSMGVVAAGVVRVGDVLVAAGSDEVGLTVGVSPRRGWAYVADPATGRVVRVVDIARPDVSDREPRALPLSRAPTGPVFRTTVFYGSYRLADQMLRWEAGRDLYGYQLDVEVRADGWFTVTDPGTGEPVAAGWMPGMGPYPGLLWLAAGDHVDVHGDLDDGQGGTIQWSRLSPLAVQALAPQLSGLDDIVDPFIARNRRLKLVAVAGADGLVRIVRNVIRSVPGPWLVRAPGPRRRAADAVLSDVDDPIGSGAVSRDQPLARNLTATARAFRAAPDNQGRRRVLLAALGGVSSVAAVEALAALAEEQAARIEPAVGPASAAGAALGEGAAPEEGVAPAAVDAERAADRADAVVLRWIAEALTGRPMGDLHRRGIPGLAREVSYEWIGAALALERRWVGQTGWLRELATAALAPCTSSGTAG